MQINGEDVFRVEVEVTTRHIVFVTAGDRREAEDAAYELYDDRNYAETKDGDEDAAAYEAKDLEVGQHVWIGGEDGNWHRWNGRTAVQV